MAEQLANTPTFNQVVIPDLWQQQAVAALRAGQDVVVQAPTGAGKTLIFELWSHQGKNRGQAIYTVPTRALANDKLAEWRARGWNAGIATGDLAENLDAPVLVATLETQKNRLIRGEGPALLVIDEYQMIGDPDRGLNYELALAMAPPQTQLLLMSGSVANPQDLVQWLHRLGRKATLIKHDIRPVPLEEVDVDQLSFHVPTDIRGYWPRAIAKALAEDLGPILVFAPRRQATEALAAELARYLPTPNPLSLSPEQKALAGDHLTRLLKCRIAYHHSGLSYGARAGVVEPLAKAGQLRVVVATMGLAAGINFSLRSVALAGESYRRDELEHPLRADEILQMFGRAGRRGIDEIGYALVTANQIRIRDSHPIHVTRTSQVDWNTLLNLMGAAHQNNLDPLTEAVRVQRRLFTVKPITLGVEESMKNPDVPCGLRTDAERARHTRRKILQILNSQAQWQPYPKITEVPLKDIWVMAEPIPTKAEEVVLRPALSIQAAMEKVGAGPIKVLREQDGVKILGRRITIADRINGDRLVLVKWIQRLIHWHGRQHPMALWTEKIAAAIQNTFLQQKWIVDQFVLDPDKIYADISLESMPVRVPVDAFGVALWKPFEREVMPGDCASCALRPTCLELSTATGTALLWRRLGLIDASGVPTRRGRLLAFFSQGDGLAIAAALEDESYPLSELVYDIANLDASFRFCGDDQSRWGGRLAITCQQVYKSLSAPGYLENGIPPKYGTGAEQVVAAVSRNPAAKHAWTTPLAGLGDIDRIIIEWRSLLRQIVHAPDLEWPRWRAFQALARETLHETESPTLTDLPPLEFHQTRRVDHRLILRRH